jgi:hypothetical protein
MFTWTWWYTPVIPATQVGEVGVSWFETNLGKGRARPYLKNKLKAKELGAWLKLQSTFLVNMEILNKIKANGIKANILIHKNEVTYFHQADFNIKNSRAGDLAPWKRLS